MCNFGDPCPSPLNFCTCARSEKWETNIYFYLIFEFLSNLKKITIFKKKNILNDICFYKLNFLRIKLSKKLLVTNQMGPIEIVFLDLENFNPVLKQFNYYKINLIYKKLVFQFLKNCIFTEKVWIFFE